MAVCSVVSTTKSSRDTEDRSIKRPNGVDFPTLTVEPHSRSQTSKMEPHKLQMVKNKFPHIGSPLANGVRLAVVRTVGQESALNTLQLPSLTIAKSLDSDYGEKEKTVKELLFFMI